MLYNSERFKASDSSEALKTTVWLFGEILNDPMNLPLPMTSGVNVLRLLVAVSTLKKLAALRAAVVVGENLINDVFAVGTQLVVGR